MKEVVLITGAAKGIGAAIAEEYAKIGKYDIAINYNLSSKKAQELKHELIKKYDINVNIYKANLTKRSEVDKMVDTILKDYGKIDILVNNAGISQYKLFTEITDSEFKEIFDVNVIGTFNVTQSVLKKCMILKHSGNIINISSVWGMVGAACEVSYSMTKSAIISMTKSLAKELSLSGIRVNAVAPGAIMTDMMKNFSKEELKEIEEEIPLNRIGLPSDVAKVVKFLSSEDSSYITGQVISPNGGWVI